jgi:predicted GIY-YIG superfamily endonuclease
MAEYSLSDALKAIKKHSSKFYVYIMRMPDGTPFYVGKGYARRIAAHEVQARTNKSSEKIATIRKIWAVSGAVRYEIVEFYESETEALDSEARLIERLGRCATGGLLVNATSGGQGVSGHVHSDASRQKMRDGIASGSAPSSVRSVRMKELCRDPEFIKRRQAGDAVAREKLAAIQRKPESRKAKSAQMKAVIAASPTLKAARVAHLEKLRNDPDAKARHAQACRVARLKYLDRIRLEKDSRGAGV